MFSIYLGNWTLQEEFDDIARQFENHPHIRLVLRVEENLTHNIFGAADIFVIPSMFEPCGLTQVLVIIPQPPATPCKLISWIPPSTSARLSHLINSPHSTASSNLSRSIC